MLETIKKSRLPAKVKPALKTRNKMKDNKKHRLGIVDFALVDAGLSHYEALIYSYVQRFERNRRPCFASIPHIAAELRLSEPSTKRHIRRLITLKMLKETTKGRGRFLSTTGIKMIPMNGIKLIGNGIKMISNRDQIDPWDRDQNDPLPLKDIPLEITKKNIPETPLTKDGKEDWLLKSMGISLDDIPE